MDVGSLLVHNCGMLGVSSRPSSIAHPDSVLSCFATHNFAKGEVAGFYYGTLVYMDVQVHNSTNGELGECVKDHSTDYFRTWDIRLKSMVRSPDGSSHPIWIVPAIFNAMRYINDPGKVPGEQTQDRGPASERK